MAGRVSWALEITGLDMALAKLREINTLLDSITSKKGAININGPGAVNRNNYIPPVAPSSATAAAAAAAAAASGTSSANKIQQALRAAGFGTGGSSTANKIQEAKSGTIQTAHGPASYHITAGFSTALKNFQHQFDFAPYSQYLKNPKVALEKLVKQRRESGTSPLSYMPWALPGQKGWPFPESPKSSVTAPEHYAIQRIKKPWTMFGGDPQREFPFGNLGRRITPPPIISRGYSSPIGPGLLPGEGLGGRLFSSLKSDFNRGMGTISKGWSTAKGGGGFGGLSDALSGGFMKLLPILGALYLGFKYLHIAVELLKQGIEHGAQLYQMAARQARGVGEVSAIKYAFQAVGMGGGELAYGTAMAQFNPKSQNRTLPGTNEIFGALRAAQFANMQQLENMAEEFRAALKDAASSARQLEGAAKSNQVLSMRGNAISREWNTLLSQTAAAFYPLIKVIEDGIVDFLKLWNIVMELNVSIKRLLKLIPGSNPGQLRTGGMQSAVGVTGAWEKMGFVFQGRNGNYAAETAKNTRTTADTLIRILGYVGLIAPGHGLSTLTKMGAQVSCFNP